MEALGAAVGSNHCGTPGSLTLQVLAVRMCWIVAFLKSDTLLGKANSWKCREFPTLPDPVQMSVSKS